MRSYNLAIKCVPVFLLALLQMNTTQAGNLSFLKDGPIAKFSDEDVKLMSENVDAALADAKTHVVRQWASTTADNSGTVETLQAYAGPNGIACKRLRITTRAGNLTGKSIYTWCDMEAKGWTLVPSDFAPPPKQSPTK
jgi:hypothetical protein